MINSISIVEIFPTEQDMAMELNSSMEKYMKAIMSMTFRKEKELWFRLLDYGKAIFLKASLLEK